MMRKRRLRVLLALGMALSAVGSLAGSASAETVITPCTGTCGDYEVYDSPKPPPYGANCKYESGTFDLDWISARPPQMHGLVSYPKDSKVQWRMMVLHASGPAGKYATIHTSNWQTAYANDQQVARAGHGFHRIFWYAPENPSGVYKVWIDMRWWKSGAVQGTVRLEYDSYKGKAAGVTFSSPEYCWYSGI